MEENNYLGELIVSYLSNELNSEEEAFVLAWINSNEQNKSYFEEIKSTWRLFSLKEAVENIDINVEWKQFKQAIAEKQDVLSLNEYGSIENNISDEEKPHKKGKVYKFFLSTAVAASIVLAIVLTWRLNNDNTLAEKPVELNTSKGTNPSLPFVRHHTNTTGKIKLITLPDGSVVKLFDKSELAYHEPFVGERNITLVGKANFKVAKDKTKTFTVFSGEVSTTAIGTEFTVTAYKNRKNIIVRLYEGKVVIKSFNPFIGKPKNDFYLLPWQEFIYENVSLTGVVRSFKPTGKVYIKHNIKVEPVANDNPSVPQLGSEPWHMFNNQPLWQVFDQLEDLFKVEIVYPKKDITKIYFISMFHDSDSIDSIIDQIARLNNLKVTKEKDKFIITR